MTRSGERRPVRIYSVLNEQFRYGFLVMAKSLLAENPELDVTFRVLHSEELSPLTAATQAWLSERVPSVEFVNVDTSDYGNVIRLRDEVFRTPRHLWAAFLILEAFRDDDDEAYVVCLDSDLVCMGQLGPELLRPHGFAAVEATTSAGEASGFFNTGVMAIGRDQRGPEAFHRIVSVRGPRRFDRGLGMADQALLSLVYQPTPDSRLPRRYNVTKRQVPQRGVREFLRSMDTVFFHFVGAKPWHVSLDPRDWEGAESEAIWDDFVERFLPPDDMVDYLRNWRDTSRALARAQVRPPHQLGFSKVLQRSVRDLRQAVLGQQQTRRSKPKS